MMETIFHGSGIKIPTKVEEQKDNTATEVKNVIYKTTQNFGRQANTGKKEEKYKA